MSRLVQVFEHSALTVDGHRFTLRHFDQLVRYNERNGNRFFAVGHNRIHFRQFVGVIQVGDLTIEILPKADNVPASQADKKKWQGALIEMLKRSGFLQVESLSTARLRLRSESLLDLYVEAFLEEVRALAHCGLVRKYRRTDGNLPVLKGRLLFREHIARNLVHRERFYTAHEFYDRNNAFNQILRLALAVVARISSNPHLQASARSLDLHFEDVERISVSQQLFERLRFNRNTERYRPAIQLARLILLNFSPDVRGGREDVMAILFDMNRLFERFVYVELKRAVSRQPSGAMTCRGQSSRRFWTSGYMRKDLRPDIVVEFGRGKDRRRLLVDTKWKMPSDGRPADDDLRQMYAYNLRFGACRSMLLYPRVVDTPDMHGVFEPAETPHQTHPHTCGMMYLELFWQDSLKRCLGEEIAAALSLLGSCD